ncbi:hypothetical protein M569_07664 [Genlisea aurea]|uniref:Polygalacturonase n=1 Tax=Genlisea aurea TaxID=192259 RepID=S8CQF7_9LAMI|nr:hypothetical protein M569_07664 [Genlisea aurea]
MVGEVVFKGPCAAGPITVQIQGNVTANEDPSAYTLGAWFMIQDVSNVIVTGGGTLDGKGASVWKYDDGGTPMAVSLVMERVSFGKMNGLFFVNSMGFHSKITDSHDVVVDALTITAPATSPNTDGIHLSNATNVNITNSVIGTGDDCVSIGQGAVNVLVSGVTCGPGHGISVGSLGKRDNELNVSGVKVIHCKMSSTSNGARIKTYSETPELQATGITFQDITMDHVANPIIIDQHYHSSKTKDSNVKISDVHFIDIKGTTTTPAAIQLDCSATHPCESVQLSNINLQPAGGVTALTATCANAKTTVTGTTTPPMPRLCS